MHVPARDRPRQATATAQRPAPLAAELPPLRVSASLPSVPPVVVIVVLVVPGAPGALKERWTPAVPVILAPQKTPEALEALEISVIHEFLAFHYAHAAQTTLEALLPPQECRRRGHRASLPRRRPRGSPRSGLRPVSQGSTVSALRPPDSHCALPGGTGCTGSPAERRSAPTSCPRIPHTHKAVTCTRTHSHPLSVLQTRTRCTREKRCRPQARSSARGPQCRPSSSHNSCFLRPITSASLFFTEFSLFFLMWRIFSKNMLRADKTVFFSTLRF